MRESDEIKPASQEKAPNTSMASNASLSQPDAPLISTAKDISRQIDTTKFNLNAFYRDDIKGIVWPLDVMKTVLHIKATQRIEKGNLVPFNYLVTEYKLPEDKPDYSFSDQPEFATLIDFLKKNHDKLPVGLRFQLAVLIDGHWTCVDNVITSRGIAAFNLDSVMDSRSRKFFQAYAIGLDQAKLFDSSYIYYIDVPSDGPFAPTPKKKVANMIQTDWVSCGIFVVDHLSFLSRTNVFPHLKKAVGDSDYRTLARADIPPALSPIFRLSQSHSLLDSLSKQQNETIATRKDSKKLGELDRAIVNTRKKGEKLLAEAKRYVQSEPQACQAIFSHNLVQQLADYANHYSKPVNDLVAYIYNALPQCQGLKDEEAIKLMHKLHQTILTDSSDTDKILTMLDITIRSLEQLNDVSAYRVLAGIISYAALNINDNSELFKFYEHILKSSTFGGLSNHTNSFFAKPSPLAPSLISHIEKAIKNQLLYNAAQGLSLGNTQQLDTLNHEVIQRFLNKPRAFATSETKSTQLVSQLDNLKEKPDPVKLKALTKELEDKRTEVLAEFNFKITPAPSSLGL
ncbi:Dot/Icm T4SS effector [Legionella beliardensis]|uniref:Dot/Icm T4SS effector n=1 Tax=Legionella beliardensis TaxID=91822 RepID=A0A378IB90_9GAMM|nr:hypothetical protein [Legionella beliardensis]STX29574.1 Dot/Icm T4SS effector [Legionella beliardensis]